MEMEDGRGRRADSGLSSSVAQMRECHAPARRRTRQSYSAPCTPVTLASVTPSAAQPTAVACARKCEACSVDGRASETGARTCSASSSAGRFVIGARSGHARSASVFPPSPHLCNAQRFPRPDHPGRRPPPSPRTTPRYSHPSLQSATTRRPCAASIPPPHNGHITPTFCIRRTITPLLSPLS